MSLFINLLKIIQEQLQTLLNKGYTMQIENIIFLNAKFKNQENPNHFDLNEKSELLHYLERKFTYTYAKSTQFKDVIFLDFNKHYIKLLK